MDFQEWLELRQKERDFAFANGLNNGDPETNGEHRCTDYFLRQGIDTFCDIGANKGTFTRRVLDRYPNVAVHAFEPNPLHSGEFNSIGSHNKKFCFHPIALSDSSGVLEFHRHPKHHEASSLSKRTLMTAQFQAQMESISVNVARLDDLDIEGKNLFLKIDTEGHEFPAIRGAENILSRTGMAAILFEYSFGWKEAGEDIESCFQFFNAIGYSFYRLLPSGLEEIRFLTSDMKDIQYCNYVATKNVDYANDSYVNVPSPFGTNRMIMF